jgi:hypothetical protein
MTGGKNLFYILQTPKLCFPMRHTPVCAGQSPIEKSGFPRGNGTATACSFSDGLTAMTQEPLLYTKGNFPFSALNMMQ